MVISIQHCMLSYSTPSAISSRSDVALDGFPPKPSNDRHLRTVNNLRRHESLMSTAADEIFSLHKKMLEEDSVFGAPFRLPPWNDEFFSPLLDNPFLFDDRAAMKEELLFQMDESGDVVSLVLSIPDFIHSENINVEVVGGRMIHIQAEKTGPGSRKRFLDKRFALGEHLNESNLEAKLSKGKLVVSAPKDGTGINHRRNIPIKEEL